jgi:putative ABC transport system substrate-binding protein
MKRRQALVVALMAAGALLPSQAFAQPSRRQARVAIMVTGKGAAPYVRSFIEEMQRLGWEKGRNVIYEIRSAGGEHSRLPSLADEVIARRPDLILAATTYVGQALKPKTTTIPIVLATSLDPVSQGLVASLKEPGGNITGMSIIGEAFHSKLVEVAVGVVPKAKRVAVLFNPERGLVETYVGSATAAGRSLGVGIVPVFARNAAQIERLTVSADVLVIVPEAVFLNARAQIARVASRAALPLVAPFVEFVHLGGLASYGANIEATFARAAHFADRILRGAKPGDLPIEHASQFKLVLNLRAAKSLGIAIPAPMLLRADSVIE